MASFRAAEWQELVDALICEHCGRKPARGAHAPVVFHHREPSKKLSSVAALANSRTWPVVLAEIAKCDILCHRCHRAAHPGYREPIRGTIKLPRGILPHRLNHKVPVDAESWAAS